MANNFGIRCRGGGKAGHKSVSVDKPLVSTNSHGLFRRSTQPTYPLYARDARSLKCTWSLFFEVAALTNFMPCLQATHHLSPTQKLPYFT